MNTRFNLKTKHKDKNNLILMRLQMNNQQGVWSTGEKIPLSGWDPEKQFPTNSRGNGELRMLLTDYKNEVDRKVKELKLSKEMVTFEKIKAHLNEYSNKTLSKDPLTLIGHYDEFMSVKLDTINPNTCKVYRTLRHHLIHYTSTSRTELTYESLDLLWYDKFLKYLATPIKTGEHKRVALQTNSTSKYVKALKTFLNWSADRGFNKFTHFKKFKTPETNQEIIYLTTDEVNQLYTTKYPTESLTHIADVFTFACNTGLRYSDLNQVCKERIKNDILTLFTTKTGNKVEIPLTPTAKAILKKYNFKLPVISNQRSNEYLKQAAKLAGINDQVQQFEIRNGVRKIITTQKWESLSMHDSRKSFISLALLAGIPADVIMSMSGHTQHSVFRKYVSISNTHKMSEMNKFAESFRAAQLEKLFIA